MLQRVWAELLRERLAEGEFPAADPGQHDHRRAPARRGGAEKRGPQAIGRSRGGLTTKLHVVAIDDYTPLALSLTPGQSGDAPAGRQLLEQLGEQQGAPALLMDRAYEGDLTRELVAALRWLTVVPPMPQRSEP